MVALKKRAYSRNDYEAPIMYANYDTENYYHAKMYNSGVGGMYFESDHSIKQNSDICIKMVNYRADTSGPEAYKAYRAKVRWCKKVDKDDTSRYGIGTQYLVKSHTVYGGSVHGSTCSCDFCGERMPSGEIQETDDFICLCMNCFIYLEELPEGKIKESIKEFLLGNVI
jgi:hypothetical protein